MLGILGAALKVPFIGNAAKKATDWVGDRLKPPSKPAPPPPPPPAVQPVGPTAEQKLEAQREAARAAGGGSALPVPARWLWIGGGVLVGVILLVVLLVRPRSS